MNKQRKVVITTTYNEMGIIIDTKSEEFAQPEPHWIPCSERLPEKNGIYFVSYEDADTWLLEWFNGKWFVYPSNPAREETETITAWMPLPEPYKERREE